MDEGKGLKMEEQEMAGTHTPGPWAVKKQHVDVRFPGPNDESWQSFISVENAEFVAGGGVALVHIKAGGKGEANARLIAAAPDLLDVVLGFVTAYGDKLLPTPTEKHLLDGAKAVLASIGGPRG